MAERLDCGRLIKQITDTIEKIANNELRELDITLMQMNVLKDLVEVETLTKSMKKIEQNLGVAQPTAVGVIKRLEQKGLVEPMGDPNDRRVKLVHLTPAGKEKVETGRGRVRAVEEELIAALSEEEQIEFARLLAKVKASLEE